MNISQGTVATVVGVTGLAFLCYCVYFDRKRRSDPNFKRKLREKRRAQKTTTNGSISKKATLKELPNLRDPITAQKFFMERIQLGEQLLATGQIEEGVDCLCQAIAVCNQPEQLLQVLQQTLPAPAFHLLIQRLPIVGKEIAEMTSGDADFIEEDLS